MNRLSEAAKFLIIAGTILIVCSLVVVGFFVMKEGKEGTNNSMAQFGSITSNHSDVELEKYHNLSVTGSTLRDLINEKFKNGKYSDITIEFHTKKTISTATPIVSTLSDATSEVKTDNKYINPVGSFKGSVTKNENGVISKITFTQTK